MSSCEQKRPLSVIDISKQGRQKFRSRRYREAQELFKQGLELEPDNPYLLSGMGDACREIGDFEEAARCYLYLLEKDKSNLFALRGLGDVYKKQGRHQDAIGYWEQYLQLRPRDKHVMSRIADSCKALQEFDAAAEAYRQIIRLDPRDRFALTGMADLMHRIGEDTKAIEYYEQVLSFDPDELHILTIVGKLCWRINDFEKAERCFRHALTLDPRNPYALYGLGNCFRWHRQYDKAIEIWKQILEFSDGTESLFTRMGDAYVHLSNNEEAAVAYQRAIELGSDPYALSGLIRLSCEIADWQRAEQLFWQMVSNERDASRRIEELNKRFARSGQRELILDFFQLLQQSQQGSERIKEQLRSLAERLANEE